MPCGPTLSLQVLLGYENTGIVIQLTGNALGASKQYLYELRLNLPNTVMYPNQVPISFTGQAPYPAGTGSTAPLDEPGWANGCPSCSVAMVTAIAQNGSYGTVPVVPFEDGAAFGPVDWERATLEDGNAEVPWAPRPDCQRGQVARGFFEGALHRGAALLQRGRRRTLRNLRPGPGPVELLTGVAPGAEPLSFRR